MRSARGQGTVEYLAVVLLIAVALGGGTAAVANAAGADLATAVPHEVQRALCIVSGGDCDRDRAPCDVASDTRSRSMAVTITVVKVGHDKRVTVIRRSDGTFAVTLDTAPALGLETSVGARGRINLGRRQLAAGGDLTAGVTGSYAHRRTWIAGTKADADRLVRTIEDHAVMPPVTVEGHLGSVKVAGDGAIGAVAGASGGVAAGLAIGSETDHRTGNRTYFFSGSVGGHVDAAVKGSKVEGSASGSDSDRYALTVAPDGRWIDLAMTRTGELATNVDLPKNVAAALGKLDLPGSPPRRWVTDSHLDLNDPQNLAAAQAFLEGLGDPLHPGRLAGAVGALSRRMRDAAVIDARTYATDTDTRGADGRIALTGVQVGGMYETSTEKARLVAATTRGMDGQWRVRDDCLKEATKT
jgi:hypothetical protein